METDAKAVRMVPFSTTCFHGLTLSCLSVPLDYGGNVIIVCEIIINGQKRHSIVKFSCFLG